MYNFDGFGKRLLSLRKSKDLTQEDLATRLSISPQAVSKWENETSYPDILMLPKLAEVLDTSIEFFFGSDGDPDDYNFPPLYEGLPFVHSHKNIGVYSKKQTLQYGESSVEFADGSRAEINSQTIVNKGADEIAFYFSEKKRREKNATKTESEFIFAESIKSMEVMARRGNYVISFDEEGCGVTTVKAKGSPELIEAFVASCNGERLVCEEQDSQGGGGRIEIEIKCAAAMLEDMRLVISGSSGIRCGIGAANAGFEINGSGEISQMSPCSYIKININGSGDLSLTEVERLDIGINGSGDVKCKKCAGETTALINGSGDIAIECVSGALAANINGSGDIRLSSGELEEMDVTIRGSGSVDAKKITAGKARLFVEHSGEITLGRVIRESVEKHSKDSKITVLKRG